MTPTGNNEVTVLRHSDGQLEPEIKPIRLNYKKWKKQSKAKGGKKKAKYTRGLKDIQLLEEDMVHVGQKASRAVAKGFDTYENERQRSAEKKKDGAIEDFIHNSAKATSSYLKEASDIPVDIADSMSRISLRKRLRKNLQRASKTIRTWPI